MGYNRYKINNNGIVLVLFKKYKNNRYTNKQNQIYRKKFYKMCSNPNYNHKSGYRQRNRYTNKNI